MSLGLPPELSRLGDDLASAADRSLAKRRHRTKVAATGIAGALIFAALTPAALGPAERPAATMASTGPGCLMPRSEKFIPAACAGAMVLDRPYAIQ
jgi:hypothetical protein